MVEDHHDSLQVALGVGGQEFTIRRDGRRIRSARGLKHADGITGRRFLVFLPKANVRVGDELSPAALPGLVWHVTEVEPVGAADGEVFSIHAYYETTLEREQRARRLASRATQGFHSCSRMATARPGNGREAAARNAGPGHLDLEIERYGGEDKEELRAMVSDLRDLFRQDAVPKGALARYGTTLEKHDWIVGPLMQSLGGTAIEFLTTR